MGTCCLCGGEVIEPFLSFGSMPLANGFVTAEGLEGEYRYHLEVGRCPSCSMVQLTRPVSAERLFHEEYAYFSSVSSRMVEHFRRFSEAVQSRYLDGNDPLVVELGSNDGIMLQHFVARGIRCLGVEPSANVARTAQRRGIPTICEFFDDTLANKIVGEHRFADAILAANVLCHIQDLHGAVRGMRTLLKPGGVVVVEDPYLGDIVTNTAYDQIYDEHVYYFSLASLRRVFESHGFELIDAAPQNVHGGSMRYTFAPEGARSISPGVATQEAIETGLGLAQRETFDQFRCRVEQSRQALVALLTGLVARGGRVVGYGATSKSTTVINYCGLSTSLIEFISDTTPGKQGKLSPGAHIPIRPHQAFADKYPDYALLFAWNHRDEVLAKEAAFTAAGGKWIVYVPEVQVL